MILNRQKKLKVDTRRAKRALNRLLKHFQCMDKEVTVVYLDDDGIRTFNKNYLNKDKPTNVLSFSMNRGKFGDLNPQILGDILISVERAAEEASRARLSVDDMLDYLLIHGFLHLVGYDHEASQEELLDMRQKEEELFFLLHGYPIHSMLNQ